MDGGVTSCDNHKYSLYTKVNEHIDFIKTVISIVENNKSRPQCINELTD